MENFLEIVWKVIKPFVRIVFRPLVIVLDFFILNWEDITNDYRFIKEKVKMFFWWCIQFCKFTLLTFRSIFTVVMTLLFVDLTFPKILFSHSSWPTWFYYFYLEVMLFILIFGGFFYYLYIKKDKSVSVLQYTSLLIYAFSIYTIFTLFSWLIADNCGSQFLFFNKVLWFNSSLYFIRIILGSVCTVLITLLYINTMNSKIYVLELPFLISLLFWICIGGICVYNLLLLFFVIEIITLLVIVASTLYFIFIGPKLIKPILHFFILNLIISTFYLFGVALLIFILPNLGIYSMTYTACISFVLAINDYIFTNFTPIILNYFKATIVLILIPLFFKLTLAPFSIWVINIYTNLPIFFLLILLTLYKIIYSLIFIKLVCGVFDFLPFLQGFWNNLLFLFVVPSFFIGCLAFRKQNLASILAFTTVSQLGYVLAGIAANTDLSLTYALFYLLVYTAQLFGIFIIFMLLKNKYGISNLNQLFLIQKFNSLYHYCLGFIFLSFAGLPPLVGFFTKYFLFLQIYIAGHFIVAFFGLVSSFFIAIIYLQISLQLFYPKKHNFNIIYFYEQKNRNQLNYNSSINSKRIIEIFHLLLTFLYIAIIFAIFWVPYSGYLLDVIYIFLGTK